MLRLDKVGQRFKYLRDDALHLTQEVVAPRYGVSEQTLSNWERGKTTPNRAELFYIAMWTRDPVTTLRWLEEGGLPPVGAMQPRQEGAGSPESFGAAQRALEEIYALAFAAFERVGQDYVKRNTPVPWPEVYDVLAGVLRIAGPLVSQPGAQSDNPGREAKG